jgi:polyferredoxin
VIVVEFKRILSLIVKYSIFVIAFPTLVIVILRCPYVIPFLACDLCPVVDCPSKYYRKPFIAFVIGYIVLFRKDFCAWVCPYGTLNDLVYKIRRKASKISIKIPLELKLSFNILKYVVFAFVVIALLNGNPRYYVPIHTSDLITSIKLAYLTGGDVYFARLYLILGALLLGFLIPRFWCRYLCPLGTTFQLIKKGFRRFKKCSKCGGYD